MAEEIKKYKIPNVNLPPMLVGEEGYLVRYRIVSEDKNRYSHWSNMQTIKPQYTFVPGSISFNKSGGIALLAWDPVTIKLGDQVVRQAHEYDIWLRWDRNDSGDWLYKERIDTSNLSITIPSTYTVGGVVQGSHPNRLSIEIFLKGTPISRDTALLRVYSQSGYTV
jgi:hypothetical protein